MLAAHLCTFPSIMAEQPLFSHVFFLLHTAWSTSTIPPCRSQLLLTPFSPEATLELFKGIWINLWASRLTGYHLYKEQPGLERQRYQGPELQDSDPHLKSRPQAISLTPTQMLLGYCLTTKAAEPPLSQLWLTWLAASLPWGSPSRWTCWVNSQQTTVASSPNMEHSEVHVTGSQQPALNFHLALTPSPRCE